MALIEIDDVPSQKPPFIWGIFHGYVKLPDGSYTELYI